MGSEEDGIRLPGLSRAQMGKLQQHTGEAISRAPQNAPDIQHLLLVNLSVHSIGEPLHVYHLLCLL